MEKKEKTKQKGLTTSCIARGQKSFAERNKIRARSSSCRAVGAMHVDGTRKTSRHRAT